MHIDQRGTAYKKIHVRWSCTFHIYIWSLSYRFLGTSAAPIHAIVCGREGHIKPFGALLTGSFGLSETLGPLQFGIFPTHQAALGSIKCNLLKTASHVCHHLLPVSIWSNKSKRTTGKAFFFCAA